MRPILFEPIKRKKFDDLTSKKKNYLIKEEDGSVSKYIAGLENESGGGGTAGLLKLSTITSGSDYFTVDSLGYIDELWNNNQQFCFELITTEVTDGSEYINTMLLTPSTKTDVIQGEEKVPLGYAGFYPQGAFQVLASAGASNCVIHLS